MAVTINVAELKANNLAKAKNILAEKGLTFANIGISDKIKINSLEIDYTTDFKAKVEDIVKNIGVSERAAITLLLEAEIKKIKIDETIESAEKTILAANQTIGKSKVEKIVEATKFSIKEPKENVSFAVSTAIDDFNSEPKKPKVVKLDEKLKAEINETAKDVCHTKGLIYPQIVISDIAIKFAEFFTIEGVLAVAEAKAKAKQLMEKTGITSERICLVYLYQKEITYVPPIRTTEKTFSINFSPSKLTIVIDAGKFNFHQQSEYKAVSVVMMKLQTALNKFSKMENPIEKLKELAEYLNNAKVKSFKDCLNQTENFLNN
jgi:hypothetical protein